MKQSHSPASDPIQEHSRSKQELYMRLFLRYSTCAIDFAQAISPANRGKSKYILPPRTGMVSLIRSAKKGYVAVFRILSAWKEAILEQPRVLPTTIQWDPPADDEVIASRDGGAIAIVIDTPLSLLFLRFFMVGGVRIRLPGACRVAVSPRQGVRWRVEEIRRLASLMPAQRCLFTMLPEED